MNHYSDEFGERRHAEDRAAFEADRLRRGEANPANQDDEITAGMLQWDTGTLSKSVLERVLIDALADLHADAFRRGEPQRERNARFLGDLKRCVQIATGVDLISLRNTERR